MFELDSGTNGKRGVLCSYSPQLNPYICLSMKSEKDTIILIELLESLKEKVFSSERRIASAFTKNLLAFTTGRTLTIDDFMNVGKILDEVKADDYRARDILAQIVARYF